jgi:hypothetical protein
MRTAVGSRRVKGGMRTLMRRSDGYNEKCCAANEEAGGEFREGENGGDRFANLGLDKQATDLQNSGALERYG